MKFFNLSEDILEVIQLTHRLNVQKFMLKDSILEAQNSRIVHGMFNGAEPRRMGSALSIIRALLEEGQLGYVNIFIKPWTMNARSFREKWKFLSGIGAL